MMPRCIDADELKESLKELKAEGNNLKYVQGLQDAIDGYFPQIIDDAPTADVQPVKHGQWIVTKTERGWNCAEYPVEWTCSECKVANDRKDDFCPHCGIEMDGDSDA